MKFLICASAFLLLASCNAPEEEEPDLDELVLSEDEEILEGSLAGEIVLGPQETPVPEELVGTLKVE